MAVRPVVLAPDPVLATPCTPVTAFDGALAMEALDLIHSVYAAYGRGLAAPQIGISQRLFVIDRGWKDGTPMPEVFVNPEITAQSDRTTVRREQCLSLPDQPLDIARPVWIDLSWQGLDGAVQTARFDGVAAALIQHERDHLDGILITDKAAA